MKKFILALLFLAFAGTPLLHAGRGGSAFGGALAGSMIGSVVGSAATRDSGRSGRAEAEARRAQDQTASLRHEQALRREMDMSRKGETTKMTMMFAFIILFLIIGALAIVLIRRKK